MSLCFLFYFSFIILLSHFILILKPQKKYLQVLCDKSCVRVLFKQQLSINFFKREIMNILSNVEKIVCNQQEICKFDHQRRIVCSNQNWPMSNNFKDMCM